MPAIQALADGYGAFVVTDTSGGFTLESHDIAAAALLLL
jgi:hypothetical protein